MSGAQMQQQVYQTPEEAELVDISKIVIDPEKQYQIYVGQLPRGVHEQEVLEAFRPYGEIKNTHLVSDKGICFVNFKTREGAMKALLHRDFYVRGQKAVLAGFHKQLQIILRRLPPSIGDEKSF